MAQIMEPTQAAGQAVPIPSLAPAELAPHFPQLEIIECLGRGGMGVVYKARQKSLNRFVALKLLAPERADDPQFAARFEKEAHALAALNHPNIVGVYDFGLAGGFYFLLMEFVDGVNLRQLLQAKRLTPKEALSIVPPVCDALQCAHDHGIVHRDIKPENLLIDKAGTVKIADFGIAKIVTDQADSTDLRNQLATQAQGTPDYAAPEQASGAADHRADIYSLGIVLYEMLTGERPKDNFVPPSKRVQVDIRIDEIVLRALEKTPELRFATAAEFRTQVEAAAASGRSTPTSRASGKSRFSRKASLGACWVPLALVSCLVAMRMVHMPNLGAAPIWWHGILISMTLLAVTAPFVTTILGWLAIDDIKRSQGRLRGLRLAGFDALLYPLLSLGTLITMTCVGAARMFVNFYANPSAINQPGSPVITQVANWLSLNTNLAVLFASGAALLIDALVARAMLQAIHRNVERSPFEQKPEMNHSTRVTFALICALVGMALGAVAALMNGITRLTMVPSFLFAIVAIFLALPVRRRRAGMSALVIAGLGIVLWPLLSLVIRPPAAKMEAALNGRVPEIEQVVVTSNEVVVKSSWANNAGLIIEFGTAPNSWIPSALYLEGMFDVSLNLGGFDGGAHWTIKPRHSMASNYRLDGPLGKMMGRISFLPGIPASGKLGRYVIGEYLPDKGEPLPIAVRLVGTGPTDSFPVGASISRNHLSLLATYNRSATDLHYVLFHEGDVAGNTSSGSQNEKLNTWLDEGSVTLKNGRTFGYRREALYPDELHINGMRFDLRKGRVIVLRDDGVAEQFRFFPSVATGTDPDAVSHLIQ